MKTLSPEKVKAMHEKNQKITREAVQKALMTIEDFFPEVVTEANNPYFTDVQRIICKKSYLTNPVYMQNIIIYVASMLVDSILDDLDIKLILYCKVSAIDISHCNNANSDFLIVTFEYLNNNTIEHYRIAIKCRVKNDYIYFN